MSEQANVLTDEVVHLASQILRALGDRRGVGDEINAVSPDVFNEIHAEIASIIDATIAAKPKPIEAAEQVIAAAEDWYDKRGSVHAFVAETAFVNAFTRYRKEFPK